MILCLCRLAMVTPGTAAEVSTASVAPPSSWVKTQFFNRQLPPTPLDSTADGHWLLLERQINAAENETFVHSVRQILTTAGVQNGATLTIDFNPAYQNLTIHWARIWRGSQHFDRLDTNQIKVVQPEREMDNFILNGRKSAILVLESVGVGDIIDYAYSLKGVNPIFSGHFAAGFPVQMADSADRMLTRVVWPPNRRLYAKAHGCSVQPVVAAGTNSVDYTWDVRQVAGLAPEDSLPEWWNPRPWVQLTEFKTWAEVSQWALKLFQTSAPLSPELSRKIAEWKRINGRESQVLTVLRFVQDDVRYFGIEIGASSEKPADPSIVFARRFGDCKDKSLLFVTILRALGFEAYPVLVNATLGRALEGWQPSDSAFDHCIAVVQCEGQNYWLDPTMNYQRGPLAAHYLPGYDRGLVVSPTTKALGVIPRATGLPATTTTEYFVLHGKTEPAELKVVTVAQGRDAEILRALFATTKRTDIEKNFMHVYSATYPGIKLASAIGMEDDLQQNRIQTTEWYSIDEAWTQPDKNRRYRCEFYPSTIAGFLKKPVDTDRKAPLGVGFPQHYHLRTEVTLPGSWPAEGDKTSIADPAFNFQKAYRCGNNSLVMEYEYQALTDWVSPERVGEYIQHLNQTSQSLGYALTWQ